MSFGKKMFNGVLWSAIDRLSMQSAQFILGIVLARLLTPKEYGTIGLLLVFTAISKVFIESGFPLALIQKKDRSKKDLSTAFVFNIAISLVCYITLYLSAPYISRFYDIELLKPLLRVMAFSLVINGLYIIPSTIFAINLDFKSLAKINFSATLIAGVFAIILAYQGYGVWALAWQTVLRSTIVLIIMWWLTDWKISFVFSKSSFKSLSSFGFNILISALLNRIVNDLSALFIGKIYSTKDLGIFSRGEQFSTFVSSSIGAIINRVLLPSLSALQDDLVALKNKFSQILKVTALISCPLYFGLFALADPLVEVLLTEKWLAVVPIMRIFCISRLITVFSALNINVLYVLGKSNLVLKQQYLAIFVRVIFVGIGLQYGIIYVAISESLATMVHLFINIHYPGKLIKYNIKKQFKDVLPFLRFSLIMLVVIYATTYYLENNTLKLIVGFITGVGSYYLLLNHFKKEQLQSIFKLIKKT